MAAWCRRHWRERPQGVLPAAVDVRAGHDFGVEGTSPSSKGAKQQASDSDLTGRRRRHPPGTAQPAAKQASQPSPQPTQQGSARAGQRRSVATVSRRGAVQTDAQQPPRAGPQPAGRAAACKQQARFGVRWAPFTPAPTWGSGHLSRPTVWATSAPPRDIPVTAATPPRRHSAPAPTLSPADAPTSWPLGVQCRACRARGPGLWQICCAPTSAQQGEDGAAGAHPTSGDGAARCRLRTCPLHIEALAGATTQPGVGPAPLRRLPAVNPAQMLSWCLHRRRPHGAAPSCPAGSAKVRRRADLRSPCWKPLPSSVHQGPSSRPRVVSTEGGTGLHAWSFPRCHWASCAGMTASIYSTHLPFLDQHG